MPASPIILETRGFAGLGAIQLPHPAIGATLDASNLNIPSTPLAVAQHIATSRDASGITAAFNASMADTSSGGSALVARQTGPNWILWGSLALAVVVGGYFILK